MKIILASKSPRRKEILENAGFEFDIVCADADESVKDGILPCEAVKDISKRKALAVKALVGKDAAGRIILAADTVVSVDGEIIGKPKDKEDAFNILRKLSGRKHTVYTGYTIIKDEEIICDYQSSDVYFRQLSDREILGYIDSGEPMDKAGAYGIQKKGALLVEKIDGDFFNVMGLPINKICVTFSKVFGINILYN